jgi:hypothetical protein
MTITREQLWNRMGVLHQELYHTGKNYVASIVGGKNGKYADCYYSIQKILPKDKNEDKILNLASIMIMIMSEDKEPLHFCKGGDGFTCSLIHRSGDKYYSEYIFMTKRDIPYVFPEEVICKKYLIDPTPENQEKVRVSIEKRVYSYKQRDSEKNKRCVTFEDAEKLDDYLLNTIYFDIYNEDEELQKLRYMAGKKVSELTSEQKTEISNYITTTLRPVLLYKSPGDSKLLVNKIPEFQTISYRDLCDTLITNTEYCSYCKCKMTLLNTKYVESGLTFDAIITLYGHKKDNITLCCSLCNSKKTFKNKLDI